MLGVVEVLEGFGVEVASHVASEGSRHVLGCGQDGIGGGDGRIGKVFVFKENHA